MVCVEATRTNGVLEIALQWQVRGVIGREAMMTWQWTRMRQPYRMMTELQSGLVPHVQHG